jgi:hypothetical protein
MHAAGGATTIAVNKRRRPIDVTAVGESSMIYEPVTIFARLVDPAGVAKRLREIAPSVEIDGDGATWSKAVVLAEEIETLRKRLFALHWRVRNYRLHGKVIDFAEFARTCWFGPLDITGLPLIEGDLSIRGKRIDRLRPTASSLRRSAPRSNGIRP